MTVKKDRELINKAKIADPQSLYQLVGSRADGLTEEEVQERLARIGPNQIAEQAKKSWFARLLCNLKNPLVLLLSLLAVISVMTGDYRSAVMMIVMIVLGVSLRYIQELRADKSAEKLKSMVGTHATVVRNGCNIELPLRLLVPGDVVLMSAGDMVPADIRLLHAKDLFVNQAALTGESLATEKFAETADDLSDPLECRNLCFFGTHVEVGSGKGIVLLTGGKTYFGGLASDVQGEQLTSFDIGINQITWIMVKLIVTMVLTVFVLNGFLKHDWLQALLFALAVGVGLTPEMMPMIVTVNLSKGALLMSSKKVIVKHLNSIQNLGAMDVLCTDKTGTITQGRVILVKHIDLEGKESEAVLNYAFLNSFYQTGLKNMMDMAILEHEDMQFGKQMTEQYAKVDEIPFDFIRRKMSVIVKDSQGKQSLICKGSVEEILSACNKIAHDGQELPLDSDYFRKAQELTKNLNEDGFRVVALAVKEVDNHKEIYSTFDENEMTVVGLLAFLDPPKNGVDLALKELALLGVNVKVLTGDNSVVTRRVCLQVGLPAISIISGAEIEQFSEAELRRVVEEQNIFAKLAPAHKERIIRALQHNGHVVGFLGDGINDAPALRSADVGISVDTGVDIAKESASMILLEKNLLVLRDGIVEGRKTFCNIVKYIKMAASSNFGNVLSILGTSLFLPFLPMLPIQILTNNLLYDFSQTTIPSDNVDAELLTMPRKWAIDEIRQFITVIGPISSIFDYLTFFILIFVFDAWYNPTLFRTGWFVESLLTQSLIIHVIRTNKIPFLQSCASWPVLISSIIMLFLVIWLPVSPFAGSLALVSLPLNFWLCLGVLAFCYFLFTQFVKDRFLAKG